jgi:hypothetical protein
MHIVRLMSLCASGKMTVTPITAESSQLSSTLPHAGGITLVRASGASVGSVGVSSKGPPDEASLHLLNLTKAIGALVQDNPASLKQLVQLCTQVLQFSLAYLVLSWYVA